MVQPVRVVIFRVRSLTEDNPLTIILKEERVMETSFSVIPTNGFSNDFISSEVGFLFQIVRCNGLVKHPYYDGPEQYRPDPDEWRNLHYYTVIPAQAGVVPNG